MSHQLRIYNTLGHEKQVFKPIDPDHVRFYVCGPTVYNYAHIGNARPAVIFDTLRRVLEQLYPKVTHVANITDVDDKIIAASKETGDPIEYITNKFTKIYREDMAALGVSEPTIEPRATAHIPEMIEIIASLIERGHAYEADGHVLFHVPSFDGYGKLSGRNRDDQIAGARVEVAPYKKDAADFVLWKPSADGDPGWDSPWGYGRPGWHIECSAMSQKHLGLPFDIHGGGLDLTFPHHENEIAQSVCAHGHGDDSASYAKYWMHNGFLTVEGEKMSKSLGNVLLAHDLIQEMPGEVIRLTLLSAHYRQPLDWNADAAQQSRRILDRLYKILEEDDGSVAPFVPDSVMQALCDDLNTPLALSHLQSFAKSQEPLQSRIAGLKGAGAVLGLLQQSPEDWFGYGQIDGDLSADAIDALLVERTQARQDKNFARADEIRDQLAAMGVQIEDTPSGPKWRKG